MDQVDGTTNLITSQQGHEGLYSRVKTDPPLAAPCQGHDVDEDELSDEAYNIQSEFNKLSLGCRDSVCRQSRFLAISSNAC